MRRLVVVMLIVLIGWLPVAAHAQTQAAPPAAQQQGTGAPQGEEGGFFGLHPVLAVVAGSVTGVILASAVVGGVATASLLLAGASFSESLEFGTGLTLPAIAASALLGAVVGHLLFSR